MHTVASLLPAPNVARNWIGRAPVHTHWRKVFKFKDHQCIYRRKSLQFSSVYALMLFHSECLVTCGAGKRLFSSVCGQVLFQSEFCYMCCRQKDVYSVYAVMLFQCELLVTFGAVKRFFFSVYGAVLFHFKFLNTCRMFFTSVYDLMLTTAYCG